MNEKIAEVTGALMGDGCLSTYWSNYNQRQRYEIAFTGHLEDYPYYEKTIKPVFEEKFNVSGRLFKRNNSTRYHIANKSVFGFFKELGVPVGKKKNSEMRIPEKIKKSKELTKKFIRGIWDTDGSIYRRYSKKYNTQKKVYNYVNLQLKMIAPELMEEINEFLEHENIKTNRITKCEEATVLRITNQESVKKFNEKIGFSNPRYRKKFKDLFTKPKALGS